MATKRVIEDNITDSQPGSKRDRHTEFDDDFTVEYNRGKIRVTPGINDNDRNLPDSSTTLDNAKGNHRDASDKYLAENSDSSNLQVIEIDDIMDEAPESEVPDGENVGETIGGFIALPPSSKQLHGESAAVSGVSSKTSEIAVIHHLKSHDDPSAAYMAGTLPKNPPSTQICTSSEIEPEPTNNAAISGKPGLPRKFPESPTGPTDSHTGPDSEVSHPSQCDIVQLMVDNSFWLGGKSLEKENLAIRQGRPTPILLSPDTIAEPQTQSVISLCEYTYQKIPWLTGSKMLGKYFCWPCVLFSTDQQWSLLGDTQWKEISIAVLNHQTSPGHLAANKTLKQREDSLEAPKSNTPSATIPQPALPREAIHRNRVFLELLVRILCSKKKKSQNTDNMDYHGIEELMKITISCDPELDILSEKPFSLVDFVSSHAGKLLASIEYIVKHSIWKEMKAAPYLSIIYEDTANVADKVSLVAVIIRYVDDEGEIQERFCKFVKLVGPRTAERVFQIHSSLVDELKVGNKLVGFSYSGTVVTPFELKTLNNLFCQKPSRIKYCHCPDHNFKELLLQALSHAEQSRYFFQVIQDLVEFFSSNSGAIPTLVNLVRMSDPECPWLISEHSFTHDMVSTIRHNWDTFVKFFIKVSNKFWNDEVVRQAPEFVRFLKDYKNRYLLVLVSAVLECVDQLSRVIESEFQPSQWGAASAVAYRELHKVKHSGAIILMKTASSPNLCISGEIVHPLLQEKIGFDHFHNIMDIAIKCVEQRSMDTFFVGKPSPKFCDVINDQTIQDRCIRHSRRTPGLELHTLKEQINSFKMYELIFNGKTIPEHVRLMKTFGMTHQFPELLAFLKFSILAAPPNAKPTDKESTLSKLKSYVKGKQKLNSSEVLLYLEKDSTLKRMKTRQFFDDVIDHYARSNNETIFHYNKVPIEQ